MSNTISPSMNLIIPTAGTEQGPQYAFDVNNSLTLIDQHTHVSGQGVPVPPAGLNINSSLTFQNNPAINLSYAAFTPQVSQATLEAVYVKGVDLYYRDGNNNEIAITTGGSVNAGSGSITGLPSGTAGVAFSASVFTFSQSTNTPANLLIGSVLLGNNTALSKYLTLAPPTAMAASFTLTLPSVPAAQSFVTLDSSGNFGTPIPYASGITGSNIAAGTITATNLSTNINLPGTSPRADSQNIVTSSANATTGLKMIRGSVDATGAAIAGEGFSSVLNSTGQFTVTFTVGFSDTPVVVVGQEALTGGTGSFCLTNGVTSSAANVVTLNTNSTLRSSAFSFIAIGQR